jgi:Subtilase family/Bacterial Ig domain
MVSAACPKCKIVVVQATTSGNTDLYTAQLAAAALHPTVISDSWGGPEQGDVNSLEPTFTHPGIAQFVAAGDNGWNDGGMGPLYPSTSANVISVGGTSLVQSATTRGWTETAWTNAGSSCSNSIAKPSFQTAVTGCANRATTEVSAVADPETGLDVYNAANGGFVVMGGTSAAAPLVASIAAATGHGNLTAAQIVASANTTALFDVTAGANGTCSGALCNSTAGWDGPTGYGTPNAAVWAGGTTSTPLTLAITSPAANASVAEGFQITASATGAAAVGAYIDGVSIGALKTGPYVFSAPRVTAGSHTIDVIAIDASNVQVHASVVVMVIDDMPPNTETDTGESSGCSVGHGDGSITFVLGAIGVAVQRRRRSLR